jgi:hypothetical protein
MPEPPEGATWLLIAVTTAALLISLLAIVLLLVQQRKWRMTFSTKEWVVTPAADSGLIRDAIATNIHHLQNMSDATARSAEATTATREEFAILRTEIGDQREEIKRLQMGHAFHARRSMLQAAIRALEAIEADGRSGSDPETTLKGIVIDLDEALEDNDVRIVYPEVGARIPTRGVDPGRARFEPTTDDALVGTIAAVDRPAYIAVGLEGAEEVLKPAQVTIYREQEELA